MTVIASAQTVALNDDPVPVFKQLAQAGGFTNVYVGYASKRRNFLNRRAFRRTMTRLFAVVSAGGQHGRYGCHAPYVDAGTGKLVVTFAVPVKENGTLKAVVAGDVAMDSVVAKRARDPSNSASSGLLLNSDGSVIAANDPALTLKPFGEDDQGH